jgi:hypothetical protein
MPQDARPRHGSLTGAIILIAIGTVLLIANIRPDFDPWPIFVRYWPLILIFIGLGKVFDSYMASRNSEAGGRRWISGSAIAMVTLAILFVLAVHVGRTGNIHHHETQAVEQQGAKTVSASFEMPAGRLTLTGGAAQLLNADFDYTENEDRPNVEYSVSGNHGQLNVTQKEEHAHFAHTHNDWDLRVADGVPLDLSIKMGAGQSDLRLQGVDVTNLEVNIGAGEMNLDLTGPRKSNLEGTIHGGVGSATVRLPKDVGVQVYASGGIGAIDTGGLRHDGGAYVNSAYEKAPVTVRLTIEGGIGHISLEEQP